MMMIPGIPPLMLPPRKIDLRSFPAWFQIAYTVVFLAVFAVMLGTVGYLLWQLWPI